MLAAHSFARCFKVLPHGRAFRRPVRCGRLVVAVLLAVMLTASSSPAFGSDRLARPTGTVILTITGAIDATNAEGRAEFDRAMLEGLPQTVVRTATPWTTGIVEFQGVLVRDLLALVGGRGERIMATALNDYMIEIPVSDFERRDVILALKKDGAYMSVRDKGPLWIIYPLGCDLSDLETHPKMIWQLRYMDVEPR